MDQRQTGWLAPTGATAYVAVGAAQSMESPWRFSALLLAVGVGLAWHRLSSLSRPGAPPGGPPGARWVALGLGLTAAAGLGPADVVLFQVASTAGQAAAAAGSLLALARLEAPPGLYRGPARARSLDALGVALALFSLVATVALARLMPPELTFVDPPTVDAAMLFGSLGGLLLMLAALLRALLLRGLELGAGERIRSALALAIAGTLLGAGSGLVRTPAADLLAGGTLVVTSGGVTWALTHRSAARVAELVRGVIALALLGAPIALLGARAALELADRPVTVTLATATLALVAGLLARSVARPLAPSGSRWMDALEHAMDAALQPEPSVALRRALEQLQSLGRRGKQRPELFRHDPAALLSVDVAGYLTEHPAEFPGGIHALALEEPGKTLRRETVLAVQVRRPDLRPIAAWFEAHDAASATALADDEGPVGLMVLPRARRRRALTLEEVERLAGLGERLTGVLSVTSALARAIQREVEHRATREAAEQTAAELAAALDGQRAAGLRLASALGEPVRATAHGAAAQLCLEQLEHARDARVVQLAAPPGCDVAGWAAVAHLLAEPGEVPFVVVDAASTAPRAELDLSSALSAARGGTLVVLGADALDDGALALLSEASEASPGPRILLCHAGPALAPERGAAVRLPSLAERADDLHGLVNFELSRAAAALGLSELGIERPALATLLERAFVANEAELRAIVLGLAASADAPLITLAVLRRVLDGSRGARPDEPGVEGTSSRERARSRLAPRSRRA